MLHPSRRYNAGAVLVREQISSLLRVNRYVSMPVPVPVSVWLYAF